MVDKDINCGVAVTAVAYLESVSAEDADVSRDAVTKLDLDDVASHQLLSVHVQLLTFTDHDRKLHTIISTYTVCSSRLGSSQDDTWQQCNSEVSKCICVARKNQKVTVISICPKQMCVQTSPKLSVVNHLSQISCTNNLRRMLCT